MAAFIPPPPNEPSIVPAPYPAFNSGTWSNTLLIHMWCGLKIVSGGANKDTHAGDREECGGRSSVGQ